MSKLRSIFYKMQGKKSLLPHEAVIFCIKGQTLAGGSQVSPLTQAELLQFIAAGDWATCVEVHHFVTTYTLQNIL